MITWVVFDCLREIGEVFGALNEDQECRAIVLSGAGRAFCAGLDFINMGEFASMAMNDEIDVSRKYRAMRKFIDNAQAPFTQIEKCQKPVIAMVHGACVGGALGILTACDIRYAANDSIFSIRGQCQKPVIAMVHGACVGGALGILTACDIRYAANDSICSIREVDLGISADVGTLQRMPKQIGGDSLLRELAFTARDFYIDEAKAIGLVSRSFDSLGEGLSSALELAKLIASKSPVAVQGSKIQLNYARDHSVDESLNYHATWNAANLLGEDTSKAAMAVATRQKDPPNFSKL